ncbi:putative transcriptional regulator [Croceifilum oryzae]|uniref:Transcriptional regulator n=1 Tax=Croceifilum oryzae TaxID=1553429 RepID=A0AAJ1WQK2_9BACL|nr:hypothetical protein [Croceifilum oryzae]MDQ0417642.1 putative transcriptional regulator [Croceifilum oryzae]
MKTKKPFILLSLDKLYFEEIKSGTKKYEFRKKYLNVPSTAFIYCPSPDQKIRGVVQFDTPIIGSPEEISLISQESTGEGDLTAEYLKGKKQGYAIPVMGWEEITPLSLHELRFHFPNFVPPQSYYRLDHKPDLLEFLLSSRIVEHEGI